MAENTLEIAKARALRSAQIREKQILATPKYALPKKAPKRLPLALLRLRRWLGI